MSEEIKVIRPSYEELAAKVERLQLAISFLYPWPWGQRRFTLHAPDALQEKWSVWDKERKGTFAMGGDPVDAAVNAQRRLNHEQCEEYKTPNP